MSTGRFVVVIIGFVHCIQTPAGDDVGFGQFAVGLVDVVLHHDGFVVDCVELVLHHVTGFCVGGDVVENGFHVVVLHRVGFAVDVVVVVVATRIQYHWGKKSIQLVDMFRFQCNKKSFIFCLFHTRWIA